MSLAPDDPLRPLADAVDRVGGRSALPCDGQGHPIEDAAACLHVRCTLPSPQREELLGRISPLARRSKFIMAALVARRDLYSLGWHPGKRGGDLEAAVAELAARLSDPEQLAAAEAVDRRGR